MRYTENKGRREPRVSLRIFLYNGLIERVEDSSKKGLLLRHHTLFFSSYFSGHYFLSFHEEKDYVVYLEWGGGGGQALVGSSIEMYKFKIITKACRKECWSSERTEEMYWSPKNRDHMDYDNNLDDYNILLRSAQHSKLILCWEIARGVQYRKIHVWIWMCCWWAVQIANDS